MPYKRDTAALAALGPAVSGVQYVKAAFYGAHTYAEAKEMMEAVVTACKRYRPTINVVAAGYADFRRFGGLAMADLVAAACSAGADLVMVDTAIKDGTTLFDALTFEEVEEFVQAALAASLRVALAGSIQYAHVPLLKRPQPDIIGVRGVFCNKGDRTTGIVLERVREVVCAVKSPMMEVATGE